MLTWSQILSPDVYSISYLYILMTRVSFLQQSKSWKIVPPQLQPDGELWGLIVTFLGCFDAIQIRYVGEQLTTLVEHVATIASAQRMVRECLWRAFCDGCVPEC